jgi:hypothetical protein
MVQVLFTHCPSTNKLALIKSYVAMYAYHGHMFKSDDSLLASQKHLSGAALP